MALREEGLSNFVYDEGEDLIRFCSQIRSHLLYTPLSRKPLPLRSSRHSQGTRRPMLLRPPRLLRPVLRGVKTCEAPRYLCRSPQLVRHPLPLLRLRRFPPRALGGAAGVSRSWCSPPLVLQALADKARKVYGAAGVAPLVVVPSQNLDVLTGGHGQLRVKDAARRVANDVVGDQRRFGVFEDVRKLALGGLPEGCVHLLDRNLALHPGHEVRDRAVRDRYTQSHPVDPALELRVDHGRRSRRPGGGRDDVLWGAPGAPGILVCRV